MRHMSNTENTQIDPQLVINDLLDQIKRLTLDNSMLRAYISNAAASQQPAAFAPPVVDDED